MSRNYGISDVRAVLGGQATARTSTRDTQRDSNHLACVQREGDLLGPVGPPMEARSLGIRGKKDQVFIPIDVRELAAAVFVSIIVTLPIALVSAAACVWFAFFE